MSREFNLLSCKLSLWARNAGLNMIDQHVFQTMALIVESSVGTGTFDIQHLAMTTQVNLNELVPAVEVLEDQDLILIDRITCEYFFCHWFRSNRKFNGKAALIGRQDFNRINSRFIKSAVKGAANGILDFSAPTPIVENARSRGK